MAVGSPATIISPSVASLQHLVRLAARLRSCCVRELAATPTVAGWSTGPAAIAEGGRDQCDATFPRVRAQPAPLLGGPRRAFPPRVEYRAAIAADVAKGACDYDIPSSIRRRTGRLCRLVEYVREQGRALSCPATNCSRDTAPVVSHVIAACFFRSPASNRIRLRAAVQHERVGLEVNFEAQSPRTFPIQHALTPRLRQSSARIVPSP